MSLSNQILKVTPPGALRKRKYKYTSLPGVCQARTVAHESSSMFSTLEDVEGFCSQSYGAAKARDAYLGTYLDSYPGI